MRALLDHAGCRVARTHCGYGWAVALICSACVPCLVLLVLFSGTKPRRDQYQEASCSGTRSNFPSPATLTSPAFYSLQPPRQQEQHGCRRFMLGTRRSKFCPVVFTRARICVCVAIVGAKFLALGFQFAIVAFKRGCVHAQLASWCVHRAAFLLRCPWYLPHFRTNVCSCSSPTRSQI